MKFLSFFFLLVSLNSFAQIKITDWISLDLKSPEDQFTWSTSIINENIIWGLLMENTSGPGSSKGFFRSIDGGQSFEINPLPSKISNPFAPAIHAIDEKIAYIPITTGDGQFSEGVYRTIDGGQQWELIFDNDSLQVASINIHFFDAQNGLIVAANIPNNITKVRAEVYKRMINDNELTFYFTEDGGDTWTQSESEFKVTGFGTFGGNSGIAAIGDTIWTAHAGESIFRSTDKGKHWERFEIGIADALILDVAFKDPLNGLAVGRTIEEANYFMVQTSDGGVNWKPIALPSFTNLVNSHTIEYIPGTVGSYIISGGGIELENNFFGFTMDNGSTWSLGFAPFKVYCTQFLSPDVGFAGSDLPTSALLKYDDNLFETITTSIEILPASTLEIYPNSTSAMVQLQLGDQLSGDVQLRVVDNLGRIILQKNQSGGQLPENWELNLSSLPKGNYRILITNGRQLVVKSVVKL